MFVKVDIGSQRLTAFDDDGDTFMCVSVSTAKAGAGERQNTYRTPRGWHVVRAKIGCGAPENTIFIGRRPTMEIYSSELRQRNPDRDWILTRILWLSGLEPGFNRLGKVDTMRRYIYIHGCPDDDHLGTPGSKGCIKMRNRDVMKLYSRIEAGTIVHIESREQP